MNVEYAEEKIKALKSDGARVIKNCFEQLNSPMNKDWKDYYTDKSALFIKPEYKVNRLLFFTADPIDLAQNAFHLLPSGEYCLDIITKDPSQLKNELEAFGAVLKARMMRISAADVSDVFSETSPLRVYFDKSVGRLAEPGDAPLIYDLLWKIFDTEISHLPSIDAVNASIERKEFTLYKGDNGNISLLQADIKPRSFYINQVYNGNEKRIIHAMLLNRLSEYCSQGGKYAFAWVDENNTASLKFHQKYKMKHDGLWDIVYKVII